MFANLHKDMKLGPILGKISIDYIWEFPSFQSKTVDLEETGYIP